jgi:hypothetical protein
MLLRTVLHGHGLHHALAMGPTVTGTGMISSSLRQDHTL